MTSGSLPSAPPSARWAAWAAPLGVLPSSLVLAVCHDYARRTPRGGIMEA
ncbi:hypothetical protein [Streptomyces sp. enrichment culture]